MVLAPEHDLVEEVTAADQADTVRAYVEKAATTPDVERADQQREKTGVFTGGYAVNPVNQERIPIWIADYVMLGYGTGAIMAVPAHDHRDFEFARKFDLDVRPVIQPEGENFDGATLEAAYPHAGVMVNKPLLPG